MLGSYLRDHSKMDVFWASVRPKNSRPTSLSIYTHTCICMYIYIYIHTNTVSVCVPDRGVRRSEREHDWP